jgi:hypothetical protein
LLVLVLGDDDKYHFTNAHFISLNMNTVFWEMKNSFPQLMTIADDDYRMLCLQAGGQAVPPSFDDYRLRGEMLEVTGLRPGITSHS